MRKPPLFSLLVCAALQLLGCFVRGQEAPDVPVTPIGTVSRLSEAEATEGKPVRVRGVVTYTAPNHWYCIVQDDTGSIVVVGPRERPSSGEFRMGVVAELEGVTAQGRLHPFIAPPKGGPIRVSIVGEGTIPEPHVIPMADLQRRAFQAVRVEVSGVVRSVKTELFANTTSKLLLVTIADEQRRLTVALPGWRSADVPSNLVGAKVRARGVFQANLMGPASQLTYRLLITDLTDLQVDGEVKPPFDLALSSIRSAFYSANRGQTNRVHVKGLLTASLGGKGYYLEDKSGAIFISVPESSPKVGESVEVTGFEVVNRGQVALENTVWRSVSPPISIVPPRVTTAAMRDGKLDGRLVQIEALLLTVSSTNEGSTLVLQEGERVFVARFAMSHTPPPSLSDGSWLRLTGICINTTAPEF